MLYEKLPKSKGILNKPLEQKEVLCENVHPERRWGSVGDYFASLLDKLKFGKSATSFSLAKPAMYSMTVVDTRRCSALYQNSRLDESVANAILLTLLKPHLGVSQ